MIPQPWHLDHHNLEASPVHFGVEIRGRCGGSVGDALSDSNSLPTHAGVGH
jgi:hypothetical protein